MLISKRLRTLLALLFAFMLVAAACGSDDAETDAGTDEGTDTTEAMEEEDEGSDTTEAMEEEEPMEEGALGTVVVPAGDAIQIRSLQAITGDVAFLGVPNERATELAIADYGQIEGFDVSLGTGLDDLCSNDGGQAAAQTIVADEQVVGVIGTSCSGAATAAAPLISAAGMVMISPANTSPALTSDLQGTAGDNYNVGYYRTAHNDLFQGAAMADFVFNQLGLTTAAAIHDGDPYTQGLAQAFADAFTALGGEVTGFTGVAKGDTDMVPVLTEVAGASPQALFFPIFQPESDFVADQVGGVSGLEDTVLLSADGSLVDGFLALEQSVGMYFSGPDTRFGDNVNESTGKTATEVLDTYNEAYGEAPSAAFWGHSYDATAILLDAIKASSTVDGDGSLVIDRAGVRAYIDGLSGYSGIIGTISCDDFGDCGAQKITIIEHLSTDDIEASKANVVFEFAP